MNKNVLISIGVLVVTLVFVYWVGSMLNIFPSVWGESEWDKKDKENPKLVFMFNQEIESEIGKFTYVMSKSDEFDSLSKIATSDAQREVYENLSKSFDKDGFRAPYIREAKANATAYFHSIASIESYARYGVTSSQPRNMLELNIIYQAGKEAKKVYTGMSVNGMVGANVLFKILLKDGKVTQAYSNGVELKNPPDWVKNDIRNVIHAAMSHGVQNNQSGYYPSEKTASDIEKEWDEVGK